MYVCASARAVCICMKDAPNCGAGAVQPIFSEAMEMGSCSFSQAKPLHQERAACSLPRLAQGPQEVGSMCRGACL